MLSPLKPGARSHVGQPHAQLVVILNKKWSQPDGSESPHLSKTDAQSLRFLNSNDGGDGSSCFPLVSYSQGIRLQLTHQRRISDFIKVEPRLLL